MLLQYKIITVTHKQINLKEISNFAIKSDSQTCLQVRLEELKEQFGLEELMYTATCNRVLYFFKSDRTLDPVFVIEFFKHINPTLSDETLLQLEEIALVYEGTEALQHLFEVSASIDSLVIGERQILGQLREAFEQCRSWNLLGDDLRLAMQQAVLAAKKVYSKTRIGDKPVSIVSLAIQKLLKTKLPKDARILMIGAGQTNQLVAKFLKKHHYTNVRVFNRTLEKAQQVAGIVEGRALPWRELNTYCEGFDCIIVCTGASEPVLTPQLYRSLLAEESGSKVIIDLAIPHNTARTVLEEFEVNYLEIEGLRALAKENMAFREKEVTKAKDLLREELAEFPGHYKQRRLEVALRQVPNEIKAVKTKAINEVFHKEMETLDEGARELVERMLSYMEKKCISIPMKAAREVML